MKKFVPIYSNLFVEKDEVKERTNGGLYVPDSVRDNQKRLQSTGTVHSVGLGCEIIKKGDRIVFGQYTGSANPLIVDNKSVIIISEEDILGVERETEDGN